jgi:hypothetical protein
LADVQDLVYQEGYTFETLSQKTDLYEAGTRHIKALDQSWEIYRYATKDELYLREFNRLQDTDSEGFIADLYDSIVDSSKKTDTNRVTLQRAIGTVHNGKVAAVYITFEYGVTANNLTTYTIQAIGIDGIPATEIDALMYANSFADLLTLYRAYEDKGAVMGYDTFAIRSNTLGRYRDSMWNQATSSSDAESGISAADEGDDDDLDDMMGVDTGAPVSACDDDDDDLDDMMGVDTGVPVSACDDDDDDLDDMMGVDTGAPVSACDDYDDDLDDMMGVDTGAPVSACDDYDDDLDGMMGVDTGAPVSACDDDDDDLDGMMGVDTDSTATRSSGTGTSSVNCYYPYASSYPENIAIMNSIWSEFGAFNLSGICEYVQQEIDLSNSSIEAARARVAEVFEGG